MNQIGHPERRRKIHASGTARAWMALGAAIAMCGAVAISGGVALAETPATLFGQSGGMPTLAPVLKKITPAVVSIETKGHVTEVKGRRRETREIRNAGSGVVYNTAGGLIVTNNHVIDHAEEISVTLTDGRVLKAQRVGGDADFDMAVIKVDAADMTAIPFADSRELQVGDFVLAIGYPMQIGQSVTSGIVSGLHRSNIGIEEFENFIQTDAAVYPGNSGGALVNLQGDLVGINTAFIGATNSNPGMGFAIPVNMARIVADQIIQFGDVRRGSLGISTDDLTPGLIRDMKLIGALPAGGAVVTTISPGSAGERAGLKLADVVTDIGDRPVVGANFLRNRLALLRVGEVAQLGIWRGGSKMTVHATIAANTSRPRPK